jgi:hypothetical protein
VLKRVDREVETLAASLKAPFYRSFLAAMLRVCLLTVLDIAIYLCVGALTTVYAVVFLYSPQTMLASIAAPNMDDAGDVASAAAMAMTIFLTDAGASGLRRGAPWAVRAHAGIAAALTALLRSGRIGADPGDKSSPQARAVHLR